VIVSVQEKRPVLAALQYVEGMDLGLWYDFLEPTLYHGVEISEALDTVYLLINDSKGRTHAVLNPGSWAIWRASESRLQLVTDEHFKRGFTIGSQG
jgi:hypothetical protein